MRESGTVRATVGSCAEPDRKVSHVLPIATDR